jgi:hypothetical protein
MRRRLFRHVELKALALGLSIVLWFSMTGARRERISERSYSIPLTVVNLPPGLAIASPLSDLIAVRLRGPFTAIRQADPSKMEAVMDLAGAGPGERNYTLAADDINAPEELEVVALAPESIHLVLRRKNPG